MAKVVDFDLSISHRRFVDNPGSYGRTSIMGINRRRIFRREEDQVREDVVNSLVHVNPAMRPVRRIYVSVLFVLLCAALGASYFYLQQHFSKEVLKINAGIWKSTYVSCVDQNDRNKATNGYIYSVGITAAKKAHEPVAKEEKSLVPFILLMDAAIPYRSSCANYATMRTQVTSQGKSIKEAKNVNPKKTRTH